MIDKLEKINTQDIAFAISFGVDIKEVEKISLFKMKNEMHTKAFRMREENKTITQKEADALNSRLREIIDALMEFDYDPMCDYIVDFDSFVKENKYYNKFCW